MYVHTYICSRIEILTDSYHVVGPMIVVQVAAECSVVLL